MGLWVLGHPWVIDGWVGGWVGWAGLGFHGGLMQLDGCVGGCCGGIPCWLDGWVGGCRGGLPWWLDGWVVGCLVGFHAGLVSGWVLRVATMVA